MFRFTALSLVALAIVANEARAANMGSWEAAFAKRCPSHHIEWMCDGCYDDFLSGFERTLPEETQSKIVRMADYSRRCQAEIGGFGCEMTVHVDAMRRLGLFNRFVAYGCAEYMCRSIAYCVRTKTVGAR